jgi:hypothetical protein
MISIIIPTFNEKKVIEATLLTLISTLTLPHEVIVSGGGSSDRTVEPVPQLRKPAIWLVPHPGGASGRISGSASILC